MASVIIWALSYFPHYGVEDVPEKYYEKSLAEMPYSTVESSDNSKMEELVANEYQQENSILGHIGKFVQPVMEPMDFGWKTCCSLLAGCAAKEVVVSTLGVLYVGDDDAELLADRLKTPSKTTGEAPFNPATALAFMVFVLLYFPCVASVTAIVKETGSWKYGLFSILYNTIVAWILSLITYKIALLFI